MNINYKEGHEDSCVIIAESNGTKKRYFVSPEDAEQSMRILRMAFQLCKSELSRVYISGFVQVTKGTNIPPEEMMDKALVWAELEVPKEHSEVIEFHKQ